MSDIVIQMFQAENAPLPEIYQWGIEVIKLIQRLESPFLTSIMKFITALGEPYFYAPVILFIFWWIDEKRGLRLGILILVSAWVNEFLKNVLKQPRPFMIEPSIGLAHASGYGLPSGHAQMSFTFWLPVAAWLSLQKTSRKRLLIFCAAVFFSLLMGFTRLYLGVHFPTDLLAGWVLGAIALVIWFIPGPHIVEYFSSASFRTRNITAALAALLMNGLYPGPFPALLLGFCLGYNLKSKSLPSFPEGETSGKNLRIHVRILRCLVGFSGIAVLFVFLRFIFPGEGSVFGALPIWGVNSPFYELGHFIRYGLIGLWASAGAPLVFQRLGLASTRSAAGKEP